MNKEFTLHYHKLKFPFNFQSDVPFNFSSLKESIIKFLKLELLDDENIFLFYIDNNDNNEKIEISNDEDLNQVIKCDEQYSKSESIPLDIKIEKISYDLDNSSDDDNLINSNANLDMTKSTIEKKENSSKVQILKEKIDLIQKNSEEQAKQLFKEIPFSRSINLKESFMSDIFPDNRVNKINKKEQIKKINKFPTIDMNYPEKGFSLFCDKCSERIIEHRFLCLICKNFNLCYNCFKSHSNQHPMIVVSEGDNKIFINKNDDIQFLFKNRALSKKNVLKSIFNIYEYNLQLSVPQHQKDFNMSVLSTKNIDLHVQNLGRDIIEPIYIFLRDSRNLKIKVGFIKELKQNQSYLINIEITSNNLIHEYHPKIHLFSNNIKLYYEPITLSIKVKPKIDVDESNIKIFDKYQNIKKWKKENKIKLYDEYFNNNLKTDLESIDKLKINGDNYWELIKYTICSVEY